ncbi:hypothetical protein [Anaerosporobacter sp.]|uniref:hypothetical protein n=1 Tax=Anaerosporobacter sp. TaxID=1872529 RepID=UPI00286F3FD5|nr:hypothetical protein [Anaerosporobacter sp.]
MNTSDMSEIVELAYGIQQEAINNRLGCILGGNVSMEAYNRYEKYIDANIIMFELTDTPLDNYAESIFQPTIEEDDDYEKCFNRTMKKNLKAIQNVLTQIMSYDIVDKIYIDINYLFHEDEARIEITAGEMSESILKNYVENGYFAPIISYCIKKK